MDLSNVKRRKVIESTDDAMEDVPETKNGSMKEWRKNETSTKSENLVIAMEQRDDYDASLPLLMRNQVKGLKDIKDDGKKFKIDVDSRPEVDNQSYSNVKIEDFGAALLRGMGWKPEIGVGNNPRVVEPVVNETIRPNLLGLGATPKPEIQKGDNNHGKPTTVHWFPKQSIVRIKSGKFQGEFAIVKQAEGVPGLNNIIVQMASGSEAAFLDRLPEIVMNKGLVESVDKESLYSDHPALILLEQSNKQLQGDDIPATKEDLKSDEALTTASSSKSSKRRVQSCWLLPGIRVRIMSRSLGGGKYYGVKGIVNDILDERKCTCVVKVDDGTGRSTVYLEKVYQDQLDTALPKEGNIVMILKGSARGKCGQLIERDGRKDKAVVKVGKEVKTYRYDDVAEYCHEYDDGM